MISIKKTIRNSTLQSLIFGALVTALIIILWDAPIKKFNIEIDPFEYKSQDELYWFCGDFNGDGNSERIRCYTSQHTGYFDIVHYDKNGNLTENWHFSSSKWNYYFEPKIFDIDNNGEQELLFFTTKNDSIYLNAVNLVTFELVINHLYFNSFERKQRNYACRADFHEFGDFDNDGKNELFFSFDAGFGFYPRGVFKIDFPSLKITASPTEHMLLMFRSFKDLNNDGIPEILTMVSAPSNSDRNKKYIDSISYITVLNYDLSFLFEPIPLQDEFSTVECIPVLGNDSLFYARFYSRSNNKNPIKLMTVTNKGKIIKQKKWCKLHDPETRRAYIKTVNNIPYIFIKNTGKFKLTETFDLLPDSLDELLNKHGSLPYCFDFNGDGFDELVHWNAKDEITIFNEKENEGLSFISPIPITDVLKFYPFIANNKVVKFMGTTSSGYFFFKYYKNKNYYLLHIINILIFLMLSGTIRALLYFQKRSIEKKWQMEKQLSELQFNSVKNQLNPHFLFNALNSVAYLIDTGQKDEAYDFLTINTRMIQRVMEDAKEIKRTINAELRFTKDYLEIQQHRFKERFNFEIIVEPDVNTKFKIPKMCIHTYVENAITHGFRNTKSDGLLQIKISSLKNGVFISVADNGMGRKAASEYNDSTGKGLKIMTEFYRLFDKYYGYKIQCKIIDLSEKTDNQTGTKVELKIQKELG